MNLIQRFAQLTALAERAQARGQSLPPQAINEMNQIYAHAQATLSPHEQAQALEAVGVMKAEFHQSFQQAENRDLERKTNYHADEMAKAATGGEMTAQQMAAAARGKPMPVQGNKNRMWHPEKNDRWAKQMTAFLGNKAMTYKELDKAMTRLEQLRLDTGSYDKVADEVNSKYGENARHMGELFRKWTETGQGLKGELARRSAEAGALEPDHYKEPTESDQLRAQIGQAWLQSASKHNDSLDSFTAGEGIDPAYLENEGVQGDVARAFQKLENEGRSFEESTYTEPYYDEADMTESLEELQDDELTTGTYS